jgi:cytochrome c peroxidase
MDMKATTTNWGSGARVGLAAVVLAGTVLSACVDKPASASNRSGPDNEALIASPNGPGGDMGHQLGELRRMIRAKYGVALPPMPIPVNNPQSEKKIELGEALFFDPNLSACGTIACGSCHIPEKGFSDGQQISDGCAGATGRRNSNTVYLGGFLSHMFWDGRVQSLEEQALGPVVDNAEMANIWDNVLAYLRTGLHKATGKQFPSAKRYYQREFDKVFDGEISTTTVTKAIASYERTVNSFGSPYDQWVQGNDRALDDAQKAGMLVFFGRGQCADCHAPPLFTDSDFHNLAVPNAGFETAAKFPFNAQICGGIRADADPGRGEVAFLRSSCSDLGRFKTPTLRNLAESGPYMHNGVFASIDDSVAHFEKLALGTAPPVVGTVDPLVAKGKILFGAGGGQPDDLKNMAEFLKALTGSQLRSPPSGIAPPR